MCWVFLFFIFFPIRVCENLLGNRALMVWLLQEQQNAELRALPAGRKGGTAAGMELHVPGVGSGFLDLQAHPHARMMLL